MADADCDVSRLCVEHYCIRDTPTNRALADLLRQAEGGTGTADAGPGTTLVGEGAIWSADSVAIDFRLTGPVAQPVCAHSAIRDELTEEQLAGLGALRLHGLLRRL